MYPEVSGNGRDFWSDASQSGLMQKIISLLGETSANNRDHSGSWGFNAHSV